MRVQEGIVYAICVQYKIKLPPFDNSTVNNFSITRKRSILIISLEKKSIS